MPRFFFHVIDGQDLPDGIGTELPDMAAVRREALNTSGQMLRDGGDEFWSGEDWRMHVVDETGQEVLTLRFSATIRPEADGGTK
jgi:hypothetical protein